MNSLHTISLESNTRIKINFDGGDLSSDALEEKDCKYAIRLKENAKFRELAEAENQALYRATKFNQVDYAVE